MISRAVVMLMVLGGATLASADVDPKDVMASGTCSFKIEGKGGFEGKATDKAVYALVGPWVQAIDPAPTGMAMFKVSCNDKKGQISFGLPLNSDWKEDKLPMKPGKYTIAKGAMFGMASIYDNRADIKNNTGSVEITEYDKNHMVGTFTFTGTSAASQPKEKSFGTATVTGSFTLTAPKKK